MESIIIHKAFSCIFDLLLRIRLGTACLHNDQNETPIHISKWLCSFIFSSVVLANKIKCKEDKPKLFILILKYYQATFCTLVCVDDMSFS